MTRRSIAAVLSSVLVALTVALQSAAVHAYEPHDGVEQQKFLEVNTTMPDPGPIVTDDAAQFHVQVVASPAQATETRAIYRVADSVYYIPVPGGMWAVLHVQPDGMLVIEDYVSGPPPANGVALDAAHELAETAPAVSCADEMVCPWLYSR